AASSTSEPQEAVAAGAVGRRPFVLDDDAEPGVIERSLELAMGQAIPAECCSMLRPARKPDERRSERSTGAADQALEDRDLDVPLAPRREHARELADVAANNARARQVLQHEVADQRVPDPVVDAFELRPRHE